MKQSPPLSWPRQIPRTHRVPLDVKHGSFCMQRVHLGDEAFDAKLVDLNSNLLIVVRAGAAVLERNGHSGVIHKGEGCLIPAGRFRLTEIPPPHFSRGEILFFFFSDRALGSLLREHEGIDEKVARLALPHLPFYPVPNLGLAMMSTGSMGFASTKTNFKHIFGCVLNSGGALALAFLKHYFQRQLNLCLFLEDHCLSGADADAIGEKYPEGATAFRKECVTYLGIPVKQWLFRRRLELAHLWLRYSNRPRAEIATRVGYSDIAQLTGDIKKHYQISLRDLEILRHLYPDDRHLVDTCLPFWFPSEEGRRLKERRRHSDWFCVEQMTVIYGDLEKWSRRFIKSGLVGAPPPECSTDPSQSAPESSRENFLELRTTKISNVISFEAVKNWWDGSRLVATPQFARLAA